MASMNAGIILAGQQPDLLNTLARADQAAAFKNQSNTQNALARTYQQQGPGILNGDPSALNALARLDPQAALGVKAQQQQMQFTEETLKLRRDEARMKAAQYAIGISKEQRLAQAEKIKSGLSGAAQFYAQQDEQGYYSFLQANGLDPQEYPFEQFPAVAASLGGVYDALISAEERQRGPKPADDYQRYAQEERAAGREPLGRIEFEQAKKGNGFSVKTPDGTVIQYGGSSDAGVSPSSPAAMIATIDGILNDPALNTSTGAYSPLQVVPGTPQKRFSTRAKQLEGQAFLQAFESLKGGGQITEIEGQKATQAIGRLDTTQSPDDYRDALNELRDILVAGQARPEGWAQNGKAGARSEGMDFSSMSIDDLSKVDVDSLTSEQQRAMANRFRALGIDIGAN